MLRAGGNEIYPCGVDRGVPQNVRQLNDIFAGPVEGERKQVAEIVGKNLGGFHARFLAQLLHFPPDLAAGDGFSVSDRKSTRLNSSH